MKKPRLLFVTERYCDGNQELGLTNNYHNLFGSLKRSELEIPFDVVHIDECVVNHNTHIDKILPKVCNVKKPDIIIFSWFGKSEWNPSIDCLKLLRDKGIYLSIVWPDTGYDWGHNIIEQLRELIDLHVSWDNAFNYPKQHNNHIWLWTPQDEKLYFKEDGKNIPCTFLGTVRPGERQDFLSYAISVKAPVMVRGGQRQEKLSSEQYASLMRKSLMTLNFPWCPGNFYQAKGRVYEALASSTLVLERKNDFTSKVIKPGVEYVEFETPQDMVEKIKFYLNNSEERNKITAAGHEAYKARFSSKHYWTKYFERVAIDRPDLTL